MGFMLKIFNRNWHKTTRTRIRRMLRGPLVKAGFWIGDRLIRKLSRQQVVSLANTLARLTYWFDARGRRIARANLRVFYGDRATPHRVRILVRACYRTATLVAMDSVWFAADTLARVQTWTTMETELQKRVTGTRPALVVAAHFGNWEMTLLKGGQLGVPLVAVVKQQWNDLMTDRLNDLRCTLGVRIVFAEGALRHLLRDLRNGCVAGFLIDQHTDPEEGGVWVDFAGLPATVSNGVALLARHTHAPVILIFPYARKNGRYDFFGSEKLVPGPDESNLDFTQRITNGLVRVIRRHPSQWMLMYRRWAEIPPEAPKERYPFYARPVQPSQRHSPSPKPCASDKTELQQRD